MDVSKFQFTESPESDLRFVSKVLQEVKVHGSGCGLRRIVQ